MVDIGFAGLVKNIAKAEGQVVTADDIHDMNTFEKPDTVTEKALSAKITEHDTVSVDLPAHSVAAITVYA